MGVKIRVASWNMYNDVWHSVREAAESRTATRFKSCSRLRFLSERFSCTPFDVMCLQEVSPLLISSLQKWCAHHNLTLVVPSQSTLTSSSNKCCVLFDKKFNLVAKKHFHLSEAVSTHLVGYAHQGESDIEEAFIKELRMRNSMATMLLLELPQVGTKILLTVCNCHIYWNPAYADVKLFHTFLIVKELFQFVRSSLESFPFVPLLLMGDFNSTPCLVGVAFSANLVLQTSSQHSQGSPADGQLSGVYELITTGRLSMKHPHHPAHLRKDEAFLKYGDLRIDPFQSAFREVKP
ncbi:hypothetical protein C922_04898 [Plasmodium inui San Antonio 1]|uniref:Endonuclease/exonuclease/phosphatase domain-containing protein n=1 Tax=Plasmodium inui San Antonio 1 TaxID=1237626 RepID=W7A6M2_9APIC|nr:hypothetical protein C922_04898 [Plasmodium inui San Antonio 1]EUD64754.1 hypothetical protein C922_04898 [Plasmodium inui San Antonio 1]